MAQTYISDTRLLSTKHWIGKGVARLSEGTVAIPEIVSGVGSLTKLGEVVAKFGCKKPLIVTDEMLVKLGLVKRCTDALDSAGIGYAVYDKVLPNPDTGLVEDGYALYKSAGCDGIIALGGGSPMDCAKIIGAKVLNPKPIPDYVGLFKVAGPLPSGRLNFPPLIAVPTTSGTGSETTVAAVISFKERGLKLVIADGALVPRAAILDPQVTASLPPHITAATGMDALTHAVESYLSYWRSDFTETYSLRAVERIGRSLLKCYYNPKDLQAREDMLLASFEAGVAFTRANVGYVHAIAHTFGGKFHTPHGVANAMVLPHVLDFYLSSGDDVVEPLCVLATAIGLASPYEYKERTPADMRKLAEAFVAKVRAMNAEMKLPSNVAKMTEDDVLSVATRALEEAHGERWYDPLDLGYPVPAYMDLKNCSNVVKACLPQRARL